MYSVTIVNATNRELTPDDVATMKLSEAGNDGQGGTGDDFQIQLIWEGIKDLQTESCDIPVSFVPDSERQAVCLIGDQPVPAPLANNRWRLTTMRINFDFDVRAGVQWFFGEPFAIFADGFETGDTSNWSSTVQ